MYRVAVIQNESEMLRYGWADLQPALQSMDYSFSYFTGENIGELLPDLSLGRFDAIVVATNACGDTRVRKHFLDERTGRVLAEFVEGGGGLLFSLQMKLSELPRTGLLPEHLEFATVNRPERGTDGTLGILPLRGEHILFRHPHSITAEGISTQCLNNEFVKSLYRGYAEPAHPTEYEILLADIEANPPRPLLMCSRRDKPGRVVITTIPLDWQRHQELLENTLTFVTEGHPHLGLLLRTEGSSFDYRYLKTNLEVSKIPFSVYPEAQLDLSEIDLGLHSTIIVDPAWNLEDILSSDYKAVSDRLLHGGRLVYFDTLDTGDAALTLVGRGRSAAQMKRSAEAWLRSQYSEGRWRGSFWQTFDAIEALRELDLEYTAYSEAVLETFEPHDIDGSYDEVLGATCAKLKMLMWFVGKADVRFDRTLEWILNKYSAASLYEQATAAETLIEVGEAESLARLDPRFPSTFANSVTDLDDDVRIYRYARTLLKGGAIDSARRACLRLAAHQTPDGAWHNTARTAAVVLLLLHLQEALPNPDPRVDEMIFRGASHLRDGFSERQGNWHDDVPATAKALRALTVFESRLVFPIDELVRNLSADSAEAESLEAVDIALQTNSALERRRVQLGRELDDSRRQSRFARRTAILSSVFLVPLLTVAFILGAHITWTNSWDRVWRYLNTMLADWPYLLSAYLITVPATALYLVLRRLEALPRLTFLPEEWEAYLLGLTRSKTPTSTPDHANGE